MKQPALKRGLRVFENKQVKFAAAIGTSQQNISNWVRDNKPLPAEYVLRAEAATGIPRHEWRPDIYPVSEASPAEQAA